MDYKLRWSEESVQNLEEILKDIKFKWTDKEVDNFKRMLSHQLDLILQNPYLFPPSDYKPELRKAVLSKQTTIFYQIKDDIIYLAYLHVNKKNIDYLK